MLETLQLKSYLSHTIQLMQDYREVFRLSSNNTVLCTNWMGSSVIIKTLERGDILSRQTSTAELNLMLRLNGHNNIVELKDVFQDEKYLHIVMEHCSRGDLCTLMIENRWEFFHISTRDLFLQIIQAVAYMHDIGFAHRDISLENILLTEFNICKLCGFGLAVPRDVIQTNMVGKPYYMAPEIAYGRYQPLPVDVWSLGIILFTISTQWFPFHHARTDDPHYRFFLKFGIRALIDRFGFNISLDIIDLIEKMLKVNPQARISVNQIFHHPFMLHGKEKNTLI